LTKRTTYEGDHDHASRPACRSAPGDWRDGTHHHDDPPHHHPDEDGPSIPFAGLASTIEVREKSPFERFRPNVKIETTPDERRVLHAERRARRGQLPALGQVTSPAPKPERSGPRTNNLPLYCRAVRAFHTPLFCVRRHEPACASHTSRLAIPLRPPKSTPPSSKRSAAPPRVTPSLRSATTSKLRAKGLVAKLPNSRRYQLLPRGYSICLVFLKVFEGVYAPLTAGLLSPVKSHARLDAQRRSQLDRLYQRVIDGLDTLVQAVGLKAA
jgi:hypothetical protein